MAALKTHPDLHPLLTYTAGDVVRIKATILGEDDQPYDLVNAEVVRYVGRRGVEGAVAGADAWTGASPGVVVGFETPSTSGELTIEMESGATVDLLGTYYHQLFVEDANDEPRMVFHGHLTFNAAL